MLNQEGFDELEKWISYFDIFWKTKLKKLEMLLGEKAKKQDFFLLLY